MWCRTDSRIYDNAKDEFAFRLIASNFFQFVFGEWFLLCTVQCACSLLTNSCRSRVRRKVPSIYCGERGKEEEDRTPFFSWPPQGTKEERKQSTTAAAAAAVSSFVSKAMAAFPPAPSFPLFSFLTKKKREKPSSVDRLFPLIFLAPLSSSAGGENSLRERRGGRGQQGRQKARNGGGSNPSQRRRRRRGKRRRRQLSRRKEKGKRKRGK